jgi:hypothetical protein
VFKIKKVILNANHILCDFQFGFRPKNLTSLALIEIVDGIPYHLAG